MATEDQDEEFLTVAEVREELGVSGRKMASLISEGILPTVPHALDKRSKLIRRRDVEALKVRLPKRAA